MDAPAFGFAAPMAPVKIVRASPPTPLTLCYRSDDSKSPEASPVKLGADARSANENATTYGADEADAQPSASARTSLYSNARRVSFEEASGAERRTSIEPLWRPDKRRIGDGVFAIKWGPDEFQAFSCAWQCVRGSPDQPAEAEPAQAPPEDHPAHENLAPPCLQHEARGACSEACATADSGARSPPPAAACAGSGAAPKLARAWGFAKACWARVRPDNDRAARTAAAASATEDLLASVAVTDVRELARRQKAYVADRRAEGISESFARAMWLHESYALNMRDQLKIQPMTVALAVDPLCAALDDGWVYGTLGRPRQPLHSH